MSGNLTIRNARLVLPERCVTGDLLIEDGVITEIGPRIERSVGEVVYASGLTVLPGLIDTAVHFREPGLTMKEDLVSGSRAAAAGGVTSFLDLPNTVPPTTSIDELHAKLALAEGRSVVHYGFFMGATRDNLDECNAAERTCGIKLHMGGITGELLIDDSDAVESFFAHANKLVAVHAEDQRRIREREVIYADSGDVAMHATIRDVESSTTALHRAISMATKYGVRLHVAHLSSAEELDVLAEASSDQVTCEVSPPHLFLTADDYPRLGGRGHVNPPIRPSRHADALWRALATGAIDLVSSNHAPHTLADKERTFPQSPPGIPSVQFMLPLLLHQVAAERCTLNQVSRWLSGAPAEVYRIPRKGRLEVGFDGDIVLVDTERTASVSGQKAFSRAGWSPFDDRELTGWPVLTAVLGRPVFRDGEIIDGVTGRELTFARTPKTT